MRFMRGDGEARTIQAATETRVPGFIGVISAINSAARTCDVWKQGSPYVIRGVKYGISLRNPPEHIRVRSAVYVRYPGGNRMLPEVSGPASIVPTTKPGIAQLPTIPDPPNTTLSGLRVVPTSVPGQRVAVQTGTARFGGVEYTAVGAKVGEDLSLKVADIGGPIGGVPKFGSMAQFGNTYVWVPCTTAPSGSNYRYDSIEIGADMIVDYRVGAESLEPIPFNPQADHILLAYILRRPGVNVITERDISISRLNQETDIYILSATLSKEDLDYGYVSGSVVTITVADYGGKLISGVVVGWQFLSGNGTITPTTSTSSSNGICTFTYFRENFITDSTPLIQFEVVGDNSIFVHVVIGLRDSNGNVI